MSNPRSCLGKLEAKEHIRMNFFRFLKARKGQKAQPFKGDAENWLPGDIAERTTEGPWFCANDPNLTGIGPNHRQRCRVLGVTELDIPGHGRITALSLSGFGWLYFPASSFRKIRPQADEQVAATAEFVRLVSKAPRPVVAASSIHREIS